MRLGHPESLRLPAAAGRPVVQCRRRRDAAAGSVDPPGAGIAAGLVVTAGFLGVSAVIGLPISLGATAISRLLPWLGIGVGVALSAVGVIALAGATVRLPVHVPVHPGRVRGAAAMWLFGTGYGAASLGCTLPLFLILVGASLGSDDVGATLLVFAAYGLGIATVLTAFGDRRGAPARRLRPAAARVFAPRSRVSGELLVVCGVYVAYLSGATYLRVREP